MGASRQVPDATCLLRGQSRARHPYCGRGTLDPCEDSQKDVAKASHLHRVSSRARALATASRRRSRGPARAEGEVMFYAERTRYMEARFRRFRKLFQSQGNLWDLVNDLLDHTEVKIRLAFLLLLAVPSPAASFTGR